MSLRDILFRAFYSPADDPLHSFYLPALAASVQYDRSAGYFRSSALAAAAAGVVRLIANDGHMRLLVGAELSGEDVQAIADGYDLRQRLAPGQGRVCTPRGRRVGQHASGLLRGRADGTGGRRAGAGGGAAWL